ncbi:Cic1p Ecym_7365 [Eremothecium cymbalariae DBVPG|uniref:Uncharacterized protein n=1 Tax=Eremothecium cymbalariae (strain CBS 270.75 / DBVPG 7215 / KCTC 17166 / NRRL Y-17582) TaxID=931890 RepID=G8JWH6_ERECY|nr:hypothetical protein Ecym_7365 [Eremothecium cymbalariae DBVPG\
MSKATPVKAKRTRSASAAKKNASEKTATAVTATAASKKGKKANTKAVSNMKDDKKIPEERVSNAIEQISKYLSSKEESSSTLIDDNELTRQLQLIFTNAKSYTDSSKRFKPSLLPVKHSIFSAWKKASVTSVKDFKLLLILKDQDKDQISMDELHELLEKPFNIKVDQIIVGQDLKTKYKAFEKRRALLSEFSLILADDSIITSLPKLLGGKAYETIQTTPVPIRTGKAGVFNKTTTVNSIRKVYDSKIPVLFPRGTTLNVHMGNLDWFSINQLCDNILSVSDELINSQHIRAIFFKSNDSPVLPLYYNQTVLDELSANKENDSQQQSSAATTVTIDGVELALSAFDSALLQIANPDDVAGIFSKQLNKAKKRQLSIDNTDTEQVSASKKARK